MASGCENNKTSRPLSIIPDRGIKYTGPEYLSLGVCTGDYLDEIEIVVLNKLTEFAKGKGIVIEEADFTQCGILDEFVKCCAADKSLEAIVDGILRTFCKVDSKISDVEEDIEELKVSTNYTINPGCLTVTNSKIDTVLNKLVSEFCKLLTQLTAIFGNLDDPIINIDIINQITDSVLNTVFNNIKGCSPSDIVKTGTGVNTILTIKGQAPIGSLQFGVWDSSYFDATGLGLPEKGMCGWAVANGKNNTIDMGGFTPAMATNTIRGGNSLSPIVDPIVQGDADVATNIGDVKGESKVKLTSAQSGTSVHAHGITQTPHNHNNGAFDRLLRFSGFFTAPGYDENLSAEDPALDNSKPILGANANITINNSVAAPALEKHENRQPTKYVNCIQRIA